MKAEQITPDYLFCDKHVRDFVRFTKSKRLDKGFDDSEWDRIMDQEIYEETGWNQTEFDNAIQSMPWVPLSKEGLALAQKQAERHDNIGSEDSVTEDYYINEEEDMDMGQMSRQFLRETKVGGDEEKDNMRDDDDGRGEGYGEEGVSSPEKSRSDDMADLMKEQEVPIPSQQREGWGFTGPVQYKDESDLDALLERQQFGA